AVSLLFGAAADDAELFLAEVRAAQLIDGLPGAGLVGEDADYDRAVLLLHGSSGGKSGRARRAPHGALRRTGGPAVVRSDCGALAGPRGPMAARRSQG